MNRLSHISIAACLLLTTLVSCGPQSTTPTGQKTTPTADDQTSGETTRTENDSNASREKAPGQPLADKDTPKPIFPALAPGDYCYVTETAVNTIHARLAVKASDSVTGNLLGTIHDDAGYYTSYSQTVNGTIDGSNLNLDVTTWIEYDRQNRQETWTVSDDALTIDNKTLTTESCDTVSKVFQNEDGLEAKDLTSSANRVKTQQVFFDPGNTSTVVSSSVVRGDRDVYQLSAQGGQNMTLSITSTEDNAVFDVVSPSSRILGTELTESNFPLEHTGDYEIIVGGTRGNATYDLSIEIK